MKTIRAATMWIWLALFTGEAAVVPYVGYVYPAGAQPGATVTVTIGGQYLKDFSEIHLSGLPVTCRMTDYLRIYDRQEVNKVRRMIEVTEAKMAEETDEAMKKQMQLRLDALAQEQSMIKDVMREDRQNPSMAAKKQFNPQIAERITLEIKLPERAVPGDYELRVLTTNGVSNPLRFQIGSLPEVTEVEPNDRVSAATLLPALPVLVNGQILPGDLDCYQFSGRQGQTLVFRTEARSLVPYLADAVPGWFQAVLTLYDEKGVEVAYDDDYLFDPDPVLIYTLPSDGRYTVAIRDSIFRGREDFGYRLSIGELPFIQRISPLGAMAGRDVDVQLFGVNLPVNQVKVKIGRTAPNPIPIRVETNGLFSNVRMLSVSSLADRPEVEPNNQLEQAYAVTNSVWINGTIEQAGDQDWYSFTGRKGEKKTVEISARRLGSPLDARLTLMNATQTVLAVNDDLEDKSSGLLTHHADARIDFTLPENGTYFVRLDDLQRKGGPEYAYRLSISKEKQDFQLRLVPSSVCVPQGGHALVTVQAIRTGGFTGEIQLSLSDAPEGIELQRAVIPEGASSVQMMIAASDRVEQQLIALEIEGEAQCDSKTQRRRAVPAEDRMQAFLYRHWVPANDFLVRVSPPKPVTVTLDLPVDGVFHARPGSEIVIPASLTSLDKTRKGIQLMLVDPPEWLTLKTANLPMRSGRIVLEVSPNAEPDDTATVLLQGVVRIDKLPSDPDYMISPKGVNKTAHDFTIDALSIRITN